MNQDIFTGETGEYPQTAYLATVMGIYDDGLALRFDGEDEPTQKHYQCNCFAVFVIGDKVLALKVSGTYVVVCAIGNPKRTFTADTADTALTAVNAEQSQRSDTATNYTGKHKGNTISFFNGAPCVQYQVSSLSNSASNAQIIERINRIVETLDKYNLIYK